MPMRSRQARRARRAGAAALVALAALVPSGCSGWRPLDSGTQVLTVPGPGPASPLEIRTHNGSVEIRAGESQDLIIEATIRAAGMDRLQATRVAAHCLEGGGTRVVVEWPGDHRIANEGCSMVIQAPSDRLSGTRVQTSNGRIVVIGLTGPLFADTSNGSIRITDHDGPVEAETSNGRIQIDRVRGSIRLDTSNGAIAAEEVDGAVVADTSNGAITLRLAAGCSEPFNLSTSNGSVSVRLGPAFAGVVDASTSNRPVTVIGASMLEGTDRRVKAVFQPTAAGSEGVVAAGAGSSRSTIRTSNGQIDLRTVP